MAVTTIEVACAGCQQQLRVPAVHAGKRAKCPKCGAVIQIPQLAPADTTTEATTSEAQPSVSAAATNQQPTSTTVWYLRIPEGEVFGPVARGELDQWKEEGRIDADCQIAQNDPSKWRPATALYADLTDPAPLVVAGDSPGAAAAPTAGTTAEGGPVASGELAPHRGTLILVLGILGLTTCSLAAGLPAWIMASRDLRAMRAGRMNRDGEKLTQIGQLLGVISLAVAMLFFVAGALMFALGFSA